MIWNHRVFKKRVKMQTGRTETWYSIKEVYYNEANEPSMYTVEDMKPGGNTIDELRENLVFMLRATYRPVLKASEIKRTNK